MPDVQVDYLLKVVALLLGGLGVALILTFLTIQLTRLFGDQAAKLDDKYFIVDFSGVTLVLGIACLAVGVVVWFGRALISKIF